MRYLIFNTNDPDVFDFLSERIKVDDFSHISAVVLNLNSLEVLRYLSEHAEVYVHRHSAFEPLPRYSLPLKSSNPKIYVTTLTLNPSTIKMEIYIPKTLVDVAVYIKLKYGDSNMTPSS